MTGLRHITTAALAIGAVVLATAALQGTTAEARGGNPAAAGQPTADAPAGNLGSANLPVNGGQPSSDEPEGNPSGANPPARTASQRPPSLPNVGSANPPSSVSNQPSLTASEANPGARSLPPIASNQASANVPDDDDRGTANQPPTTGGQPSSNAPEGYSETNSGRRYYSDRYGRYGGYADSRGYDSDYHHCR